MFSESYKAERGVYSNLMPQYFAEHVLRIYTKKTNRFGLVQAGYRVVLATMQQKYPELDIGVPAITDAPTPPATEAPSTPKTHSRTTSFTLGNAMLGSGSGTTPFSNNTFTTVPTAFVPGSPSQSTKRVKGIKRTRNDEEGGSRSDKAVKKRK